MEGHLQRRQRRPPQGPGIRVDQDYDAVVETKALASRTGQRGTIDKDRVWPEAPTTALSKHQLRFKPSQRQRRPQTANAELSPNRPHHPQSSSAEVPHPYAETLRPRSYKSPTSSVPMRRVKSAPTSRHVLFLFRLLRCFVLILTHGRGGELHLTRLQLLLTQDG